MSIGPDIQRAPPICRPANRLPRAGYSRGVPPPVVPPCSADTRPTLGHHSLLGYLCSTIIHSLLLVALGLVAVTVRSDARVVLQLLPANTSAAPALEILETVQVEPSPLESDATAAQTNTPALEVLFVEPTLFAERGLLARQHGAADGSAVADGSGRKASERSDNAGTFFGARAFGNEFVYVVDMSFSMGFPSEYGDTRFEVACRELLRSIDQLNPEQHFCVFMFCYHTRVMFDELPQMLPATLPNKQRLTEWIRQLKVGPGTDPRYGTMLALRLDPDAIFLLSDGEFNGREKNAHRIKGNVRIEALIDDWRKTAIPIHTVAFEDILNRKRLRRISSSTAGTHRFVGRVSSEELVIDDLRSANQEDLMMGLQSLADGSQRIHDPRKLRHATTIIANKLTSDEPAVRRRAHQALRVLAGGEDMGPDHDQPEFGHYAAAEKKWKRYWAKRFREQRAAQRQPGNRQR